MGNKSGTHDPCQTHTVHTIRLTTLQAAPATGTQHSAALGARVREGLCRGTIFHEKNEGTISSSHPALLGGQVDGGEGGGVGGLPNTPTVLHTYQHPIRWRPRVHLRHGSPRATIHREQHPRCCRGPPHKPHPGRQTHYREPSWGTRVRWRARSAAPAVGDIHTRGLQSVHTGGPQGVVGPREQALQGEHSQGGAGKAGDHGALVVVGDNGGHVGRHARGGGDCSDDEPCGGGGVGPLGRRGLQDG